MGNDESAVCDPTGRVRGLSNVWVADASVLRTAGDRHPTLTVLAHAQRAADALAAYLTHSTDNPSVAKALPHAT
jgi:choline dehydrogenase-like flavoprotein